MNAKSPGFHAGSSVALIGVGTIGSAAASLLARIPEVRRICLVDHDEHDESNRWSQQIQLADIGRRKVDVMAAQIHAIRPELEVETFPEPVAAVPLAKLRSDVLVGALDNRAARVYLNRVAFRLGIRWFDTGLDAELGIGRVNGYQPGDGNSCMLCAWSDADFEMLGATYPCVPDQEPAPTGAAPELGTLIGALVVGEVRKLLSGDTASALIGRQVVFDMRTHQHFVARLPCLKETCRFDHRSWAIEQLDGGPEIELRDALALAGTGDGRVAPRLSQEGQAFVRRLVCVDCGHNSRFCWRLSERIHPDQLRCSRCGGRRMPVGFDQVYELDASKLEPELLASPLSRLGYRSGDVFTVSSPRKTLHLELT